MNCTNFVVPNSFEPMLPYIKDSPTFWEAEGLVNDAIQEISPILKSLNTLYGEYVNVLTYLYSVIKIYQIY